MTNTTTIKYTTEVSQNDISLFHVVRVETYTFPEQNDYWKGRTTNTKDFKSYVKLNLSEEGAKKMIAALDNGEIIDKDKIV